jgi:hypothetical protein
MAGALFIKGNPLLVNCEEVGQFVHLDQTIDLETNNLETVTGIMCRSFSVCI